MNIRFRHIGLPWLRRRQLRSPAAGLEISVQHHFLAGMGVDSALRIHRQSLPNRTDHVYFRKNQVLRDCGNHTLCHYVYPFLLTRNGGLAGYGDCHDAGVPA